MLYVKGGAAVTSNSAFINSTIGGVGIASASSTRWGGVVGIGGEVPIKVRTGRSVSNTITSSWVMQTIRSQSRTRCLPVRPTGSVRTGVDMVTLRLSYKFGGLRRTRPLLINPFISQKTQSPGIVRGFFILNVSLGANVPVVNIFGSRRASSASPRCARELTLCAPRGETLDTPGEEKFRIRPTIFVRECRGGEGNHRQGIPSDGFIS